MQSHLIQCMVFELSAVGSQTDLDAEKKANRYHQKIIVPGVEECFQNVHSPDQHMIINHLEIDLGVFTAESFEKEAKNRLIKRLGKKLRQAGGYKYEQDDSSVKHDTSHKKNFKLSSVSNNGEKKRKQAGKKEVYYQAFIFFLDQGRFPWWFVVDHQEKDNEAIEEQFGFDWVRSLDTAKKADLKLWLRESGRIRTRLTTTFDAEWTGELLYQIGLAGREALILWTFIHPVIQEFPQVLLVLRQHFWTSWILAAGKEKQYPDIKRVLKKTARGDEKLFRELSSEIHSIYKKSDQSEFPDRINFALQTLEDTETSRAEQDQIDPAVTDSPVKDQWQKADKDLLSDLEPDEFLANQEISEDADLLMDQLQDDADREEDPVFIQAAGLVLLHPFIAELFEQTELWDGESWLSDEASFRAVRLLSYLTFGDADVPEYRLLFHKILAGLELETVLYAKPALSADELSACDELLSAVIGHWEALRNTTPEGLREGFLLREGKLTASDKGYRLHIEKRTEDILLSRLPWGYSMVQLPWMNDLLTVSWI